MYSDSNIIFVVFAGLGALLVVIPLPKALASGNVGTSMLIIWTELATLIQFVDAIRWNRNIKNWAPAWCDFCGYFLTAADVALTASSVSINRRLYMIVTLHPRRHEKAFNTVVNIVLCRMIPSASIALQYVVQQYRFYIYEDIGCLPGVATVNLAFPLVWMLPLFAATVSAGYACVYYYHLPPNRHLPSFRHSTKYTTFSLFYYTHPSSRTMHTSTKLNGEK
ncbi:STE3-domain-containing protein [Imleria badia]|nr:STE3-domain-containing protein [Imleria badia]